jgi:hypothetical protein
MRPRARAVGNVAGAAIMTIGLIDLPDQLGRWAELCPKVFEFFQGDAGRWALVIIGMFVLALVNLRRGLATQPSAPDGSRVELLRKVLVEAADHLEAMPPVTGMDRAHDQAWRYLVIMDFVDDAFAYNVVNDVKVFQQHNAGRTQDYAKKLAQHLRQWARKLTSADVNELYDPPSSFQALLKSKE